MNICKTTVCFNQEAHVSKHVLCYEHMPYGGERTFHRKTWLKLFLLYRETFVRVFVRVFS